MRRGWSGLRIEGGRVVVADAITCVASDGLFEIHFSRGRRAAHIAASVGLIFLAAFFALTLLESERLCACARVRRYRDSEQ